MSEIREGYKQTKVGVIPEDWGIYRIDNVLQRIRKKVEVEKEVMYQQIGIRSHTKGIFHKELVSGEALGNKSVFWIEEDCFIVNIVFAWEQAVAKTTDAEKGMIASHRFPMYKAKDNKVAIDYILYFFKSKRGKHLLGLASPGGAGRNKTLGQKEFSELKLPLPSLKEQKKIGQVLITWDDAINKQEAIIEAKETLKKGLIQKLLSEEIRFDGFDGEWEEVQFGDIFERITRKNTINNTNVLTISAQHGLINQEDFFNKSIASKDLSGYILLKKGEFAYNKSYSNGYPMGAFKRLNLYDEGVLSSLYIYFKIKDDNSDFYEHYFEAGLMNKEIYKIAQEGARNHGLLNMSVKEFFNDMKIMQPPKQEQEKIAQVLTTADKEIELLKEELETLKEQKRGLMQRLLSGVVRVRV